MNIVDVFYKCPPNKKMQVLRVVRGWSQKEAAEQCCTNAKGYWLWENGKSKPRKNSRVAIARAFNVSVEDIFCEEVIENKNI